MESGVWASVRRRRGISGDCAAVGDGREGGGVGAETAGQEAEAAARDGIGGVGIEQKETKLTKIGTELSQRAGVKH